MVKWYAFLGGLWNELYGQFQFIASQRGKSKDISNLLIKSETKNVEAILIYT